MSCPQRDLIMAMCLYYDVQHHSVKEICEPNVYDHLHNCTKIENMRAEHGKLNKITVSITSYNSRICFIGNNEMIIQCFLRGCHFEEQNVVCRLKSTQHQGSALCPLGLRYSYFPIG